MSGGGVLEIGVGFGLAGSGGGMARILVGTSVEEKLHIEVLDTMIGLAYGSGTRDLGFTNISSGFITTLMRFFPSAVHVSMLFWAFLVCWIDTGMRMS